MIKTEVEFDAFLFDVHFRVRTGNTAKFIALPFCISPENDKSLELIDVHGIQQY